MQFIMQIPVTFFQIPFIGDNYKLPLKQIYKMFYFNRQ